MEGIELTAEDLIEIQWTSGSLDEARKVSRYLVQERLVACAQIIPWIESIFMWNNKLDTVQESKIFMKTKWNNYAGIREFIKKNCQYEVPEILWTKIDGGDEVYMQWENESAILIADESVPNGYPEPD